MTLLQQALEALETNHQHHTDYDDLELYIDSDLYETNVKAITALREAIEAGAVVVQGWHSVETKLPEPEVDVLCYGPNRIQPDLPWMMFVDWYGSKPDFGRGVTHWQPLPPKPTKELADRFSYIREQQREDREAALSVLKAQPAEINWKQCYEFERGRANMWIAKYEKDIGPLQRACAQPTPPPECQTEAEKTAYAFGWWKALESVREQPDHSELISQLRTFDFHGTDTDHWIETMDKAADALEGK